MREKNKLARLMKRNTKIRVRAGIGMVLIVAFIIMMNQLAISQRLHQSDPVTQVERFLPQAGKWNRETIAAVLETGRLPVVQGDVWSYARIDFACFLVQEQGYEVSAAVETALEKFSLR